MLEVSGTLIRDCAKGADVSEQKQSGTIRTPTLGGWKTEPRLVPVYTDGLPFGALHPIAPVPLRAGDILIVNAETAAALRVERDGEIIWQVEELDGMEQS